ncbi:MAG: 4-hydroxy-tetrahydrodipicolinate reductase [Porphyromonas sp.]|nr:4-hydroxy-tetrahydrodipicolinate reductase [Porphyromonas sp.]
MNITLIGYGKMGHEVERVALTRGHTIVARIDEAWEVLPEETDVVIEFTEPEMAADNILKAVRAGYPVVSGTTGWLERWDEVKAVVKQEEGTLFYASNYSIGVYLFRKLSKKLSKMMRSYPTYLPSIEETHHVHKLDYPSGTALSIAKEVENQLPHLSEVYPYLESETDIPESIAPNALPIKSIRRDEVPGTHTLIFDSPVDTISITHEAKGREGFALGAVLAAEFVVDKVGLFGMKDLVKADK